MDVLSRTGLSWDRLRNFCAVAEAGSIVKATGGDPVRQSLFSRQIRELEGAFEVELVRRQGRGLAVTDEGRRLAAVVRAQMQALRDFDDECRSRPVTFSLAGSNTLLDAAFVPKLPALRRDLPGVAWRIRHMPTHDTAGAIQDGRIDFALIRSSAVPARVEKRNLGTWQWTLAIPPGIEARGRSAAATLASLPLVLPMGGALRDRVDAYAGATGTALNIVANVDSFGRALQCVASGIGAAILPSILLEKEGARLLSVPLPSALRGSESYVLAWRRRLLETRREAPLILRTLTGTLGASGVG